MRATAARKLPCKTAENIQSPVLTSIQIHAENGRKNEQNHSKIEHHYDSRLGAGKKKNVEVSYMFPPRKFLENKGVLNIILSLPY